MSNYSSQYESYYNNMVSKKYVPSAYSRGKGKKRDCKKILMNRITRELIGVLILMIFVLVCKFVVTDKTTVAYEYSKKIINKKYDYSLMWSKAKDLKFGNIQTISVEYIDKVKSKISGTSTIKDKIKNFFSLPINETVLKTNYKQNNNILLQNKETRNGITFQVPLNTEVLASYDGKVKECGQDKKLGKYILIDHGEGIETKYSNLKSIEVKKGDKIKQKQIIGKSGEELNNKIPNLYFQILYMGEVQNSDLLVYDKH